MMNKGINLFMLFLLAFIGTASADIGLSKSYNCVAWQDAEESNIKNASQYQTLSTSLYVGNDEGNINLEVKNNWGENGYMRLINGQNNRCDWYTFSAEY